MEKNDREKKWDKLRESKVEKTPRAWTLAAGKLGYAYMVWPWKYEALSLDKMTLDEFEKFVAK